MQLYTWNNSDLHLLSQAFPALRSLHVGADVTSGDAAVFSGLQSCTQLRKLCLCDCTINDEVLQSSVAALASLPHLKDLTLQGGTPLSVLDQLTGLTRLSLQGSYYGDEDCLATAAQNSQLQCFELSGADAAATQNTIFYFEPSELQQLLTACPSITHLHLGTTLIDQEGLDTFLSHGTNISSLAVWGFNLTQSRVNAACQWRELSLSCDLIGTTIEVFAYLPLRTVQELGFACGRTSVVNQLQLPQDDTPKHQLPQLLLQATTNLAACPAWQVAKPSQLMLSFQSSGLDSAPFTKQERADLLGALAPLAGPHLTGLQLHADKLVLGRDEVFILQRVLGTGLTSLDLHRGAALEGFWDVLDEALPSLGHIKLTGNLVYKPEHVKALCTRRSASQPLILELSDTIYTYCGCDELRASLAARGVTHIRIVRQQQQQQL
jgi:hypothetical protein